MGAIVGAVVAVVGAVRPFIGAVVAFVLFGKAIIIDHVEAKVGDIVGAVVVVHVVTAIVEAAIVMTIIG